VHRAGLAEKRLLVWIERGDFPEQEAVVNADELGVALEAAREPGFARSRAACCQRKRRLAGVVRSRKRPRLAEKFTPELIR
jgi:hypothetical protein